MTRGIAEWFFSYVTVYSSLRKAPADCLFPLSQAFPALRLCRRAADRKKQAPCDGCARSQPLQRQYGRFTRERSHEGRLAGVAAQKYRENGRRSGSLALARECRVRRVGRARPRMRDRLRASRMRAVHEVPGTAEARSPRAEKQMANRARRWPAVTVLFRGLRGDAGSGRKSPGDAKDWKMARGGGDPRAPAGRKSGIKGGRRAKTRPAASAGRERRNMGSSVGSRAGMAQRQEGGRRGGSRTAGGA
jgi:hypothetical protein